MRTKETKIKNEKLKKTRASISMEKGLIDMLDNEAAKNDRDRSKQLAHILKERYGRIDS